MQKPIATVNNISVDIVSRDGANVTHSDVMKNASVNIGGNSIVVIHASANDVVRYIRQGDDLLIVLEDGTTIECKNYFLSPDNQLVFETADLQFEHVTFEASTAPAEGGSLTLQSHSAPLSSLEVLMESTASDIDPALLWGGLGLLVGGVAGALIAGGSGGGDGDGKTETKVIDKETVIPSHSIAVDPQVNGSVINSSACHHSFDINGTSNFAAGTAVTVTVNGKMYACVTGSNGAWCVTLSKEDVSNLPDATYPVTVAATDAQTGDVVQTATTIVVNTALPVIHFNPLGDNVVNAAEIQHSQTLSGTVANAQPGDVLVLTLNGHSYQAVIQPDMCWQVTLPGTDLAALANGEQPYSASIINASGNRGDAQGNLLVDTLASSIQINNLTADNVINRDEHGQAGIISGTAAGAAYGDLVTVIVGGKTYTTTVDASGKWQIGISAADMQALGEGTVTVSATVVDAAGNTRTTTHNVQLDLTGPAVAINSVSGENIVDAHEQQQPLTLTGTCGADAVSVTVLLNGKEYAAIVTGGVWSVTVPAADVANLAEGAVTVTAVATDVAGNSTVKTHDFVVNTTGPVITINALGDDLLNAAEVAVDQTVTGKVTGAVAGDSVLVTLNGQEYTATVAADLTWSVTVPGADLTALAEGKATISAEVTNAAGNTGTTTHDITVDTSAPVITIDKVTTDDILNSTEHGAAQIISGTTTGAEAGATVTVTLNDKTYFTVTDATGKWSVGVPADDVAALAEGKATIQAEVSDTAGNKGSATHDVTLDLTGPAVTIDTVSTDDIVNAAEKGTDLALTGTCGVDAASVTVTLNGKDYTATVTGGVWSVTVPAADVANLADGTITVTAVATDAAGNITAKTHDFAVNTAAPAITIDALGDDLLNAAEVAVDQTVTGKVTGAAAGDSVLVTLNGQEYTATVAADLTWSVTVPGADLTALAEGKATISAEVTNAASNTGTTTHDISVDTSAPVITIDKVTTDDILNSAEHGAAQIISGTTTGAEAGATVTVTLNGKTYTSTTDATGKWSVGVPADDVAALAEGKATIQAEVSDTAGNKGSATHDVTLDLTGPAVTIDTVSTDDIVNAAEKGTDLALTGTCGADAASVTVTLNGKDYTATVTGGVWSVTVPAMDVANLTDGTTTVTAVATDAAGNTIAKTHDFAVNTAAPAITIDALGDGLLNAAEVAMDQTVTGKVTGAVAGDSVLVTLNGQEYTATVASDLTWSVTVSTADLTALAEGKATISAEVTNAAGNKGSTTHDISVDLTAPTIAIDKVTTDDILNSAEHNQNQFISGTSTHCSAGDTVTLKIGSKTYTTEVDADGVWTFGVPASVVKTLPEGDNTLQVTITDKANNSTSATKVITVITTLPTIDINPVSEDDVINAAEAGKPLIITGTSDAADGAQVTVVFNGKSYSATVSAGGWSLSVPAGDVSMLANSEYTVTASVVDQYFNSQSTVHDITVDVKIPVITFDQFALDNVVNAAECQYAQTLSGQVVNAKPGDTLTVHFGTFSYDVTVKSDLTWSVEIAAQDIQSLGDGPATITAEVTTTTGNHAEASLNIVVDAGLPQLTISVVSGDDVINVVEHDAPVIITGTSHNVEAGAIVTVTVNGVSHDAVVNHDGTWQVGFTQAEVASWPAGELDIQASVNNAVGNATLANGQIQVNLEGTALIIDPIAVDNTINGAEKAANLTITGKTIGVESDCTVQLTFGAKSYTATIKADGTWSAEIPAADMALLIDGQITVQALVINQDGNKAASSQVVLIDTQGPGLSIDVIAEDNIINVAEHANAVIIRGHSDAGEGKTVHVTLDGETYSAFIDKNGQWSVTVPKEAVSALTDGINVVSVSVSDDAGNLTTKTAGVTVDNTAPTLAFDDVQIGDNVINATEHEQAQVITGTSAGLVEGTTVLVKLTSATGVIKTYSTAVDEEGNWSIGITANIVRGLADGTYTLTADATDLSGNPADQAHHDVQVKTRNPELSITTTSAGSDDVVNKVEKQSVFVISGETNLPDGTVLTVVFNGKVYHPEVSDGQWTQSIPAVDMASVASGSQTIYVQAKDAEGNTATTSKVITVDTVAPIAVINVVATDDIINAAEAENGQTVSGRVINGAAGDIITLKLGDKTYTSTVASDLTWRVDLSADDLNALDNGAKTITVTVTDSAGNTSINYTHDIGIAIKTPELTIDDVSGDNIINTLDHGQSLIITGKATHLSSGDVVKIIISDGTTSTTYYGMVQADGKSWTVTVPKSDVATWENDAELTFTASASDDYGNTSADVTASATVNLSQVAISLDRVAGDDIINALEAASDDGLTLTGQTFNAQDGNVITITFAGKTFSTVVSNPEGDESGTWTLTLSKADLDGLNSGANNEIKIAVTNDAGNSAEQHRFITYEPVAPVITIAVMSQDNILNSAELGEPLQIKGTAALDAVGQTLTVTLNGKTYTTTVNTDGTWSVSVSSGDLINLQNGLYDVKAEVSDRAGNHGSALAEPQLQVMLTIPKITIDPVSADNFINAAEHSSSKNLVITGTTTDAKEGAEIRLTLDGVDYTTTAKADGTWSITINAAVVSSMADGLFTVDAVVNDGHGNTGNAKPVNVIVDTVAPTLSINTIATDNILNTDERACAEGQTITGTASVSEAGRNITLTITGDDVSQTYTAIINAEGKWSLTIPAGGLAELVAGNYTVTATVKDAAGNEVTKTKTLKVDDTTPVITIDVFTVDDQVNSGEYSQSQIISGITDAPAGKTVTVIFGEGTAAAKTYTATVGSDGTWRVSVSAADLALFSDGHYVISASVDNGVGNHGSAVRPIVIDVTVPLITFDTAIAGQDNIVNLGEQAEGIRIKGTTTAEPGQTVTLIFNNGSTYSATVAADGSWYVDLPGSEFTSLVDGSYTVTAVVTDKAGNTSAIASKDITVSDETAALTINDFTGDIWLNNAEAGELQKISGTTTAPDGQVVTIKLNGKTYTATVQDGQWQCEVSTADLSLLTDGSQYNITASVSNAIGNQTEAAKIFTVDKTAPAAAISISAISDDTGLSTSDFITRDTSLTINGALDGDLGVNEKAQISIDGGATWIDLLVNDKSWSYSDGRVLADGTYTYNVRVIDAAGNISASTSQAVVVDTTKPADTTTLTISGITTDSGLSGSDFITNDTTLTIQGALGAELQRGEHAQISLDNGATWVDVDINGLEWSFVCDEMSGNIICKVRIIDEAGNVGCTVSQDIIIDTAVSDAVVTITAITDNSGETDDFKTHDTTLTISGTLNKALAGDEIVQISVDNGAWITVTVSGTTWEYTDPTPLSEGTHSYKVHIIDTAGNIGSTAEKMVIIDNTVSDATITVTGISNDTGVSQTDFITADNSPTLSGTLSKALAADEWLEISLDGSEWVKVAVNETAWIVEASTLTEGEHIFSLRIMDDANNVSGVTTQKVVIDTQTPEATAVIVSYTDNIGKKQGDFRAATPSDDKTPVLSGTLTKALANGEKVEILRNGVVIGTATVTGTTWTFSDSLAGQLDNTYHYTASVVDMAGNATVSAAFDYILDTSVPTVTAVMSALVTQDTTPVLSGTFAGVGGFLSGHILEVIVNGKTYSSADGTVVVDIPNQTWYVQIPDAELMAVSASTYDVSMQISTFPGCGGAMTYSSVDIDAETTFIGPEINKLSNSYALAGGMTLNANGLWMFTAADSVAISSDNNSYSKTTLPLTGNYNSSVFFDYNRDGHMDIIAESSHYTEMYVYTNTGTDTFTKTTINPPGSEGSWYGSVITLDFNGDGYADFIAGDSALDSWNYYLNKGDGTFDRHSDVYSARNWFAAGTSATKWTVGMELSAVDLNNDGKVDVAMHSNAVSNYSLTTMLSDGDGTFTWQQNTTNAFYTSTDYNYAQSMTWADFNGDGYMDLYMSMWHGSGYNGKLLLNDTTGNLITQKAVDMEGIRSGYSLAIDWNHDGSMDIVKLGYNNTASYVYLNNGSAAFTKLAIGNKVNSTVTAISALDFDWDGAKDVLVSYSNGTTQLIKNTHAVANGTSLHFKILDQNGINCFFGNTVNLYDSAGNRVATQILNTQTGIGVNDASALVDFYGLNANETYRIELVYQENGVAKTISAQANAAWGGLQPGASTDYTVLSVEAGSANNNATFVGSGYNDTFVVTAGTDIYDGSGGWNTFSEYNSWSKTGGMDVVDFKLATKGVTVDLSNTAAQSTGFNTVTLKNIEGVAGSNYNDILTGNAVDNMFEGRGGDDTINLGHAGHDTLLYKLLSQASDGGVGHDIVNGFTVGTWEGSQNTSRIDIHELLKDSGYTGTGSAHYINNVATLDGSSGDIEQYVHVVQNGDNVDIKIDRDGTGEEHNFTTVVTLNNTHTDLATLLANHQLIVG